jgi:hypothetical protein
MQFRQLARQIVTYEQNTEQTPDNVAVSAGRIYTKLLASLSVILGQTGSRALFRRSLRLTGATYPFFSAAQDANLETLLPAVSTCLHTQGAEVAHEASVELLAIHLELLATFIGRSLIEQLVREVWPHLPLSASEEHDV